MQLWSARSGHCLVQVGTARQSYACYKNVNSVGSRITVSIAMELLLLRLNFLFYQNFFPLKSNCFQETAESCGLGENVFEKLKKVWSRVRCVSSLTSLLFTPALERIKLSDEDSSCCICCIMSSHTTVNVIS